MGAPQIVGPSFVSDLKKVQIFAPMNGQYWIVSVNNALYLYQLKISVSPGVDGSGIFKSVDGGTTWVELDASNAPPQVGTICYDVANNRLIAALISGNGSAITLMPFDLISETWGPAITTIGPTAQMTMYAFIRPDTTIFIIYYALFGNVSRLRGTYWNGAAWHASIDLGSNSLAFVPSGNIGVTASSATMDSGGTIHMVYESGNTDLFYQAFLPSNVLGQFNHFGTFAALGLSSVPGDMAIFKNSLLVPYSTNGFINSTILVGTPLNAPVWTVYNPPAMTYPGGLIDVSGVIVADGTNAYWITNFATDITFAFIAFQMFISQDGTNWSVVPDNSTAPYLYDFAVSPLAPNTDTSFGVANSTAMIVTTASGSTVYAMTLVKSTRGPLTTTYVLNAEFFPLAPSGPTSSPILNPAELPVVVLPNPRVKC